MNKKSFNDYISQNPSPVSVTDRATRWGIPLLAVFLFALVAVFFWYNNRSAYFMKNAPATTADNGNFFSQLFKPNSEKVAVARDSDGDSLSDDEEAVAHTNSALADTDNDGLNDREEVKVYKTDPTKSDSDGDGMSDGAEILARRNPLDANPKAEWPPRPTVFLTN